MAESVELFQGIRMPNHQSASSRSGKNRTSRAFPAQSMIPIASFPASSSIKGGHAFMELPLQQRVAKMSKSFRLPILNKVNTSRIPSVYEDAGVRSPMLTCRNEWKLPTYNESVKVDSNSSPLFIRSVSASESESWSDDIENETTAQLQANLTRLDDLFYSSDPATSNKELYEEIKLWQSRFPFLRVVGKKAKIFPDNGTFGSDVKSEKEEIIVKDGDYGEDDLNPWTKITTKSSNKNDNAASIKKHDVAPIKKDSTVLIKKDDTVLRKNRRNSEISQLTSHFIVLMTDEISPNPKPTSGSKSQSKINDEVSDKNVDETGMFFVDINDNRLKPKENLKDILNISPISLKLAVPKSSRLTNLSKKNTSNRKSKTSVTRTANLHYEHKLSTRVTHSVSCTPRSTTDNQMFLPSESSFFIGKPPSEFYSKKASKKSAKSDKLSASNTSRRSTLPPLKNPGLRPTSAVYNSHNRLPNDSRPTSSFILVPSLLKDDFAKTKGS